jgi:hypothetical protein
MSVWQQFWTEQREHVEELAALDDGVPSILRAVRDLEPDDDDDDGSAWGDLTVELESAPRPALQECLALLEDMADPLVPQLKPYRSVLAAIVDLVRAELDPRLAA